MMGVYVMDHCANCANAWNCDQIMKGVMLRRGYTGKLSRVHIIELTK